MGSTGQFSWYSKIVLAILALAFSLAFQHYAPATATFTFRVVRNAFLPGTPTYVPAKYPSTPDDELVEQVTVVIGAKDFISQTAEQIEYLGTQGWPTNLRVIVSYSNTVGFEDIEPAVHRAVERSPLRNLTLVDAGPFANPFTAWLEAGRLATTPYILLMHSDMYPMDGKQFLTELYEAAKAHPEYGVQAPELYEAETPGYLCHHTTQTNLHMRKQTNGALALACDGDLVEGLNRHAADFVERPQEDFLEDHAFLIKSELLEPIIDPGAAYTMEYLDMQIGLRALNTTVWYVPSSRAEYRVWHSKFRWQDATFFAYRRSERLARWTKDYLSNKWGIEFPNTGFSNFVKFSVVRNAFWTRETPGALPDQWKQQAGLYFAWFEVAGFNYFGDQKLLPEFLGKEDQTHLTQPTTATRAFPTFEPEKAAPASGFDVTKLVDIREKTDFVETDLPQALLSTAVAKYTTNSSCSEPGPVETLQPYCGLLVEETKNGVSQCTCWIYVAPYGYDSAMYKGFESVLRFFNLPERIAVYAALKLENEDLFKAKEELGSLVPAGAGEFEMTVCADGTASCQLSLDGFNKGARLLQWSFRLNSLSQIKSALRSAARSENALLWVVMSWGFWVALILCISVAQHPKVRKHINIFMSANRLVCSSAVRS
mmetsp:Transcript_132865/g.229985  ORF Transcript_132865/g.229985 Transcript_132865/m.229985 type:complete len:655 (+) Transcript_132865:78-2042(+)